MACHAVTNEGTFCIIHHTLSCPRGRPQKRLRFHAPPKKPMHPLDRVTTAVLLNRSSRHGTTTASYQTRGNQLHLVHATREHMRREHMRGEHRRELAGHEDTTWHRDHSREFTRASPRSHAWMTSRLQSRQWVGTPDSRTSVSSVELDEGRVLYPSPIGNRKTLTVLHESR